MPAQTRLPHVATWSVIFVQLPEGCKVFQKRRIRTTVLRIPTALLRLHRRLAADSTLRLVGLRRLKHCLETRGNNRCEDPVSPGEEGEQAGRAANINHLPSPTHNPPINVYPQYVSSIRILTTYPQYGQYHLLVLRAFLFVLCCAVLCYIALHCVALRCVMLWYVVLCCVVPCRVVPCRVVLCGVMCTALCWSVVHDVALCCIVLCCVRWYYIVLCGVASAIF